MRKIIFWQVQLLIKNGINIVELRDQFFVYQDWQDSFNSSTKSVDHNSFKGLEVTEFFGKFNAQALQEKDYIQQFENYINDKNFVRVTFNKVTEYFRYSS